MESRVMATNSKGGPGCQSGGPRHSGSLNQAKSAENLTLANQRRTACLLRGNPAGKILRRTMRQLRTNLLRKRPKRGRKRRRKR